MRGRETRGRIARRLAPRPLRSLLIAIQFLTRLPSPGQLDVMPRDIGRSIVWFPLVGLLIGTLVAGLDAVVGPILERPVTDALIVWALVAVTGALHIDGLIDTADGLSVGPDADARLEAMRRSTAAVPGALAGCAVILALYAALAGLAGGHRTAALLAAPLCGRSAILLSYAVFPYPRPGPGVSRALKEAATPRRVVAGFLLAAAAVSLVAGAHGLLLLGLALAVALAVGKLVLTRVTGLTGDNHGAICELSQLATLVAAPIVLAL